MKDFIKAMDDLPLILKIILALPALDIVSTVSLRALRTRTS